MKKLLKKFRKDEAGAVTVDWVIITASAVAMSAISFYLIRDGSTALRDTTADAIAEKVETFGQ